MKNLDVGDWVLFASSKEIHEINKLETEYSKWLNATKPAMTA